MILFDERKPSLAREYWGEATMAIQLAPGRPEIQVKMDPRIRAMMAAVDHELDHRWGFNFFVTRIFGTWEQQDKFYPTQAAELGFGPQSGKAISVHMVGRGLDGYVLVPQSSLWTKDYNEAMDFTRDYLNRTFPYAWNNRARSKPKEETAVRHEVVAAGRGYGDHVHVQLSW